MALFVAFTIRYAMTAMQCHRQMLQTVFGLRLRHSRTRAVRFVSIDDLAREILAHRERVPVLPLVMAEMDGRSGLVAKQGQDRESPDSPAKGMPKISYISLFRFVGSFAGYSPSHPLRDLP